MLVNKVHPHLNYLFISNYVTLNAVHVIEVSNVDKMQDKKL
jgi:hypothetical protein